MTAARTYVLLTGAATTLLLAWVVHSKLLRSDENHRPQCDAGPSVDVAGHLGMAAGGASHPLRGIWRWGSMPVGIAVGTNGSVYWTQYRADTIERVDANGENRETVASVDGPLGLAYDHERSRLFYVTDRLYPRSVASLTVGGQPQSLICGSEINRPFAIALAERSGRAYWTESINGRIRVADFDGSHLDTVFDDGIATVGEAPGVVAMSSAGIAIDERRGLVFWSDLRTGTIVRARLDGSDRRTILGRDEGLDFPTALALDEANGKLYWADPGSETIHRSDLDGSSPEVVASADDGVLEPYGLAIDDERRLLYWTDLARNALYRTALDRTQVERFVDLEASAALPSHAQTSHDACERETLRAQRDFLRHWVKAIRTCVIALTATKAVLRSPDELATHARTCSRQLRLAHDDSRLRDALGQACTDSAANAAIEETHRLGADILAEDLPHAGQLLSRVRPFIAADGLPGAADATAALAMIDDVVARLDRMKSDTVNTNRGPLPVSGQTTRYAAVTRLADGATAVADDGTLQAGSPLTYVDNGDGTITDRNTGLMWEKKCDGCDGLHDVETRYRWTPREREMDVTGWLRAVNIEDGTGLAGHADWRLPEIEELLSIVDYGRFNPAVSDTFDGAACGLGCGSPTAPQCSCTALAAYWTAGNSPRPDDVVPAVQFNLGLVLGQKTSDDGFVRAVRGTRVDPRERFVDNDDGTITDLRTGLMWEKKCRCAGALHDVARRGYWSYDGAQETVWDWLQAINRENTTGFAGHGDWRIPNVKELFSLFDAGRRDPSIAGVFVGDECADLSQARCSVTADELHWSSTTFADFPSLALAVGFGAPGALEKEPPPGVVRVVGGVEPHEKTLRMVTRAVRGPVSATP